MRMLLTAGTIVLKTPNGDSQSISPWGYPRIKGLLRSYRFCVDFR